MSLEPGLAISSLNKYAALKSPTSRRQGKDLDGVATLKVRRVAFDALNTGFGALGKEVKLSPPRGRPLKNSMICVLEGLVFRFVVLSFELRTLGGHEQ